MRFVEYFSCTEPASIFEVVNFYVNFGAQMMKSTASWSSWFYTGFHLLISTFTLPGREHKRQQVNTSEQKDLPLAAAGEKPSCELVELYRWKDRHGIESVMFLGLDGRRYKYSFMPERALCWQVCPEVEHTTSRAAEAIVASPAPVMARAAAGSRY